LRKKYRAPHLKSKIENIGIFLFFIYFYGKIFIKSISTGKKISDPIDKTEISADIFNLALWPHT